MTFKALVSGAPKFLGRRGRTFLPIALNPSLQQRSQDLNGVILSKIGIFRMLDFVFFTGIG